MTRTARKPPFADASPAQVREALIPEEQAEFDRQWRAALDDAAESLTLDRVLATLESWRRIAWMTTAHGVDAHRRMLDRVEETLRTGEPAPGAVSADEVRELIEKRLSR